MVGMKVWRWFAQFDDGSFLNESQNSNFKRDVLPRSKELTYFGAARDGIMVSWCMKNGELFIFKDGKEYGLLREFGIEFSRHVESEYGIGNAELRPILFRRNTETFNKDLTVMLDKISVLAIGWQATVKISVLDNGAKNWRLEDYNLKHILYLRPDGRILLG